MARCRATRAVHVRIAHDGREWGLAPGPSAGHRTGRRRGGPGASPLSLDHHQRRPENGDRHPARVAVERKRHFHRGREPVPVFLPRGSTECEPLEATRRTIEIHERHQMAAWPALARGPSRSWSERSWVGSAAAIVDVSHRVFNAASRNSNIARVGLSSARPRSALIVPWFLPSAGKARAGTPASRSASASLRDCSPVSG